MHTDTGGWAVHPGEMWQSSPLAIPFFFQVTWTATEPVAWLHKAGHNEIPVSLWTISLNDKGLLMILSPCIAIPSKANILKILTELEN